MHRSSIGFVVSGFVLCILTICSCSREEQHRAPQGHAAVDSGQRGGLGGGTTAVTSVSAEERVLSSADNLTPPHTEHQTLSHSPQGEVVFSELGRGVAYVATDGVKQWVVHNGRPGPMHSQISYLTISPDGQRVTYRCILAGKQQFVEDGVARQLYDNVRDMEYSPDSRHLAYLTQVGVTGSIVLDNKVLGSGPAFGHKFFTKDSSKFVYTIRPGGIGTSRLVIMDIKSGARTEKEIVDIPHAVNLKTERIAVAVQEGDKQRVIAFSVSSPGKVHASGLYDKVHLASLGDDGKSVAFVADRGEGRYLVLNDREERLPDGLALNYPPVIRPDLRGAGIILSTLERYNRRDVLHQAFHKDGAKATYYSKLKDLVYSSASNTPAVVAKEGEQWFVLVNGKRGPTFDMIVTPMFSPDGRWLVYRARQGNRRLVVVADAAGKEHRRHPEYEMVFPTVFTADGTSVAYGVKTGNQLIWKVEKLP